MQIGHFVLVRILRLDCLSHISSFGLCAVAVLSLMDAVVDVAVDDLFACVAILHTKVVEIYRSFHYSDYEQVPGIQMKFWEVQQSSFLLFFRKKKFIHQICSKQLHESRLHIFLNKTIRLSDMLGMLH